MQRLVERPVAHKITAQTATSADTVHRFARNGVRRMANGRFIGHFETVGHVARERRVDNGRFDVVVFDEVDDCCPQKSRLPEEGAARLHDDLQVRILGFKLV